ncbi:MAG: hypothetical protein PVH76_00990 [Myxococcales bacterium]
MSGSDPNRIPRGDPGFLLKLLGGVALFLLAAALILGVLDKSSVGSCAARGFFQVTETPALD